MEFVKCNLCGGQDYERLFFARDHVFHTEEKFQLVKCSQCGLVFLNPRPSACEIGHYYPYRFFYNPNIEKETEYGDEKKVDIVERLEKGGRILDIGCGKGGFLGKMQSKGWEVFGVDISTMASTYAREKLGIKNIYSQDLLDVSLPEHFFDVISLWHVIEHLPGPLGTLKRISRLLKEDGVLIIECPNFDSLSRIVFRDKWFPLSLPRHFYQFTPQILK
jgi:SAM-dependent methyltransferase